MPIMSFLIRPILDLYKIFYDLLEFDEYPALRKCIVTFTTVGYGDYYPTSVMGKLIGAATMIAGILVMALPISVISENFTQVVA